MSVLVCLGRAKSKNVPRGRDVRYELEEPLSTVSSWVVSIDYGLGLSLFSEFIGRLECWLTLSFLGFFPPLLPWVWLCLYTACVHRECPLFWRVLIFFSLCLSKKIIRMQKANMVCVQETNSVHDDGDCSEFRCGQVLRMGLCKC